MNREIKFRAWTGHEMCYDVLVGKFGAFYVNPSNNGLHEKDSASLSTLNTKYPDTVNIMQFTGLHDKNGKEIYEGDILSFITQRRNGFQEDGKKLILKPVEFGEFCYGNNVLGEFIGFHIDGSSIQYKLSHGCEIIGNIYENPELCNP